MTLHFIMLQMVSTKNAWQGKMFSKQQQIKCCLHKLITESKSQSICFSMLMSDEMPLFFFCECVMQASGDLIDYFTL